MPHKHLDIFIDELSSGEYTHTVEYEDGTTDSCGSFRFKMSLPNLHSASGDYPFDTAPWLLPPKVVDGKTVPNIVTVNNRNEYKALLKKHGMVEPESPSDKLTMYEKSDDSAKKRRTDKEIDGDLRMYNKMLRNPEARKKVIRDSISKSRSLLNA